MRCGFAVILIAVSLAAVLAAAPPAALASTPPAAGQSAEEQWQRCGAWDPETEGANPVIQACTAAIQSGRLNSEGLAYALGKRAYAYYVDYEWESALQDANRSIELNSSNAWVVALRGSVWEELDETGRALDDYNRSIALDATDSYVFYRRGRVYEDLEMVDNALRDFDTAIRLDPADRDSMRRRAIIYEGHFGDIDRAIAEWEHIVALGLLDPSDYTQYGYVRFRRGDRYFEAGQYLQALDDYEFAKNDPFYITDASQKRGAAYNRLGWYSEAIAELDVALGRDPDFADALVERAIAHIGLFEYDEAIADLDRALRIAAYGALPWALRARVAVSRGDTATAISASEEALARDSGHSLALAVCGIAHARLKDFDHALADLDAALAIDDANLKIDATDGLAMTVRASIYLRRGEHQRGIEELRAGSDRLGVRAGGYYAGLAGGISATLGGLDAFALQSYDGALGWMPDDPLALGFRGHSHLRSGNLDKARADYERALAIDPTLAAAWFGRGVVKQRTGDPSGGGADIAEATRLLPGIATAMAELGVEPGLEPRAPVPDAGVPDAKGSAPVSIKPSQVDAVAPPAASSGAAMDAASLVDRGLAFQQQGDIERAIQDYTRALELDPQYALAYYDRGTAYQQRRELGLAIADYSRAVALDPGHTDGFYNRGLAYLTSGQAELALADLTRVLASDPRYLGALQSRGVVYHLLGSYQRAIADFNAALALQAADPWSLFGRGVAQQMAGDLAAGDADIAAAHRLQADIAAVMAAYGVTPQRQP